MSRGQESQVFDTAKQQNATAASNAQQSYQAAQSDIGQYSDALAKFAADNPYAAGGEYQTAENRATSGAADATAQAAQQALQAQSVRSGQNVGGAVAASEAMQQAAQRQLATQQAEAEKQRIGAGSAYGEKVLTASEVPAQLEAALTSGQLSAQEQALGQEQQAAKTPSFGEELFGGLMQAGSSFAGGFAGGLGKKG